MLQWMTMNLNVSAWLLNQWLDRYDRLYTQVVLPFNPLDSKGNYSATSHNTKLVHWPLMGGLLHLVQRGETWVGCSPAQSPPRCTKCNSPPIYGQCTNHCIAVWWSVGIKGLNSHMQKTGVNEHGSRLSAVDPLWPNSAECCCSAADSVRQMIDGIVLI